MSGLAVWSLPLCQFSTFWDPPVQNQPIWCTHRQTQIHIMHEHVIMYAPVHAKCRYLHMFGSIAVVHPWRISRISQSDRNLWTIWTEVVRLENQRRRRRDMREDGCSSRPCHRPCHLALVSRTHWEKQRKDFSSNDTRIRNVLKSA